MTELVRLGRGIHEGGEQVGGFKRVFNLVLGMKFEIEWEKLHIPISIIEKCSDLLPFFISQSYKNLNIS